MISWPVSTGISISIHLAAAAAIINHAIAPTITIHVVVHLVHALILLLLIGFGKSTGIGAVNPAPT